MENKEDKKITLQEEFFQKKKAHQLRTKTRNFFRVLSIIIICCALVLLVLRSISFIKQINIFSISNVSVTGNEFLSFANVIEILDINQYNNLFQLNIDKMKKELEKHPRIKKVTISRILPDRLSIHIEERRSIALINLKKNLGHRLYEVDEEGVLLAEDPYLKQYDLPIITYYEMPHLILGDQIRNEQILEILNIIKSINEQIFDFQRVIAEINIIKKDEEKQITMYLNIYNIKVLFGQEINVDKLYKLNQLLLVLGRKLEQIEYIDFKFNEAVSKYRT